MAVIRIVPNIGTEDVQKAKLFYEQVFGLQTLMDMGWIATLGGSSPQQTQISIASEGGSGTAVPDISIEVDDLDATYQRALDAGAGIEYPLTKEPWGLRRFYLRDPAGKLINVLQHEG